MSGGEFTTLAEIVAFITVVWFSGRIARMIHISPIIGEIAAGIIMGPEVANVVPGVTKSHGTYESLWQVFGTFGVTLMIAESGTHIHFDKLRKVGGSAFVVAIIGTFLPLITAMLLGKHRLSLSLSLSLSLFLKHSFFVYPRPLFFQQPRNFTKALHLLQLVVYCRRESPPTQKCWIRQNGRQPSLAGAPWPLRA